jgi:hypothetical protein
LTNSEADKEYYCKMCRLAFTKPMKRVKEVSTLAERHPNSAHNTMHGADDKPAMTKQSKKAKRKF